MVQNNASLHQILAPAPHTTKLIELLAAADHGAYRTIQIDIVTPLSTFF